MVALPAVALLAVAVLSGCQSSPPGGDDAANVAAISLTPSATTVAVGATATFTAVAKDADGNTVRTSFTWSSSVNAVATVDNGIATTRTAGVTIIRARAAGVTSDPATLTVTEGGGGGGDDGGGDGGGDGEGGGGDEGGGDPDVTAFLLPFAPGGEATNVHDTTIAVDAAGGVHAAYYALTGDPAIYYAYCPGDCDDTRDFAGGTVAVPTTTPTYVNLVLDPDGHPRLLWTQYQGFEYGACDTDCTDAANWRFVAIGDLVDLNWGSNRMLALDALGRPRFVYNDDSDRHFGSYLMACDADCLSAASWTTTPLASVLFTGPSLSIGSDGLPRFGFIDGNDAFAYIACFDAYCSTWTGAELFDMASPYSDYSLRLDAQDHPRLALFTGPEGVTTLAPSTTYYLTCEVACADPSDNDWQALGLLDGQTTYQSVALVLDALDHPRIAVTTDAGMNVAGCDVDCIATTDGWSMTLLDGGDALDAEQPVTPPAGCGEVGWAFGDEGLGTGLSIALDPIGNPRLGYDIRNIVYCSGHAETSIVFPRFASLTLP